MKRSSFGLICILALAACGETVPKDAQQTADVLTGDAKGAAADNPVCKLFNPSELETYVGEPLNGGENAAMGNGCQWKAKDGGGDVMIQTVPADYTEVPSLADGYRAVPELGEKGFVVPELGGWAAGAVLGKEFVKISVTGAKANADKAVAFFKEVAKRRT